MKPSFSPYISIPILSLPLALPILGLVGFRWEPWEIFVLCLIFLGTVAVFAASPLRLAVVGRGDGYAVAYPPRPHSTRATGRVADGSDPVEREAVEEDCTVWDCF